MHLPPHVPVLAVPAAGGGIAVHVGLASPVVLTGLGLDERAFVASLEGGRPILPSQARRFARVISQLQVGGALATATDTAAGVVAGAVAVHGAGALGIEVAAALHTAGMSVALHDDAPVAVEPRDTYRDVGEVYGTCAGAAAHSLARRGVSVRIGGEAADLDVVIFTGAPDPALVSQWMRADRAHILVACDGESVVVSHVVVPGLSACARCRDIALTRADPAWPYLAMQLAGSRLATRRPVAPRLALLAAAVRIAARAAEWWQTGEPGVTEIVGADGHVCVEPLPPERSCGCGAAGGTGDEVAARRARMP